jgi:hypothetical protein
MGLAIIGLDFYAGNGRSGSLQDLANGIHLEIVEGLDGGPEVRGANAIMPLRPGEMWLPRVAGGRSIVLQGFVSDSGVAPYERYRTALDWLHALFAVDAGLGLLVATMEDGSTRRIRAGGANWMAGSQHGPSMREYSIELRSPDAHWWTNFGSLRLDEGYRVLDAAAIGYSWGDCLDDSERVQFNIPSASFTFSFETLSQHDVERVRAVVVNSGPGPWALTVLENGTGLACVDSSHPDGCNVDNFARTISSNTTSGKPDDLRRTVTLNAANRGGEYIRLPAGRCSILATGFTSLYWQARVILQWFPSF